MKVFVRGIGAVSPAGWGVPALRDCLAKGAPLSSELMAEGAQTPLHYRPIAGPPQEKSIEAFARMRRAGTLSLHALAAASESLKGAIQIEKTTRLGLIVCAMAGSVNYSRRFYQEMIEDPATASPLMFAETALNGPASHLGAVLGAHMNYTLIGDQGTYLQGLAMAANWLLEKSVDACLVIGAEEVDWVLAKAFQLLNPGVVVTSGAGALLLAAHPGGGIQLECITTPYDFVPGRGRFCAIAKMREELPECALGELLCDSRQDIAKLDQAESRAWVRWNSLRLSPKAILGEGGMASAAWQCVAAVDALRNGLAHAANVSVVGSNHQAIGARFINGPSSNALSPITSQ